MLGDDKRRSKSPAAQLRKIQAQISRERIKAQVRTAKATLANLRAKR